MKKILILFLLISYSTFAQKIPDYGFNKVRITEGNKDIQAELKPVKSNPDLETDRFYYWYGGNGIHSTQGGFSGRLLNGNYTEYYLNRNLKEQGIFNRGLKDNIWQSWSDIGILLQFITWKNGVKSGKFIFYDDHGNLKQSGTYEYNLLNGPVKNYKGNDSVNVVYYKHGAVIVNKPPSFWNRINILKKRDKIITSKTIKTKLIKSQ